MSQKYDREFFENISKDWGKVPFGFISPIDLYMANEFFLYSLEYSQKLPGWCSDIFMRCLSYPLIKIHRKFTIAYLLCDKASLKQKFETSPSPLFPLCLCVQQTPRHKREERWRWGFRFLFNKLHLTNHTNLTVTISHFESGIISGDFSMKNNKKKCRSTPFVQRSSSAWVAQNQRAPDVQLGFFFLQISRLLFHVTKWSHSSKNDHLDIRCSLILQTHAEVDHWTNWMQLTTSCLG